MKQIIFALVFLFTPLVSFAATDNLTCPVGQVMQTTLVSSSTPAVTHTVHHNAVTHTVHHNAITHQHNGHTVIDVPAWDEVIVDVAAYDEVVIDTPAQGATYSYTCVTDSNYVVPKPIVTGGTQPFCSSPTAPGWNVSLPGGGCGNGLFGVTLPSYVLPGSTLVKNGQTYTCPWWFFMGCMVK